MIAPGTSAPAKPKSLHPLFRDLAIGAPHFQARTVFDVGANVGQTTARYLEAWPDCTVTAFEPIAAAFDALKLRFFGAGNVRCERLALGSQGAGAALMTADGVSTMNALVGEGRSKGPVETVIVERGDDYCRRQGVAHIDFLKIDTEGHDLEVLVGFEAMIAEGRIDLIQVEAGMNPLNRRHVPFRRFLDRLEPLGYYLFGAYDQMQERNGRVMLRRANLVFAGGTLATPRPPTS